MPQGTSIAAPNSAALTRDGRAIWPAGTNLDIQRAAAALERIRSDARAVFEILGGSRHHARAVIQAKTKDIAGLASRSLVSLAESHIDLMPEKRGNRTRR